MGCSPIGHSYGVADEETAIKTVHAAYAAGINLFDVSPYYGSGRAEQLLGAAIKSLPREDIIVCTKIGKYSPEEAPDYSAGRVRASISASMQRLGVSYIDILHCHDIEFCPDMRQTVDETLPALQQLKQQGVIRAIGITGYPLDIFSYILDKVPAGTVDVVLSYCHNSLHDTSLLELLPYLQAKGVGVISAAPLCMGLWRPQGPEPWHPAPPALQEAARQCAQLAAAGGVSLPRLAVKAAVQQAGSGVAVHLMGMAKPEEVADNVAVMLDMYSTHGSAGKASEKQGTIKEEQQQEELSNNTGSSTGAECGDGNSPGLQKKAAVAGLSAQEASALVEIRRVLQPVANVTWPVGVTGNRK
uniref:NADP-dependent oxidoreductase domain-containing protein n=1 Tax=Tetradesmus obliquus TaxID=3088 RepID=A0A383VNC4_TETOB|eukprot:jgi/Sobl393_1/11607/SZX67025.1